MDRWSWADKTFVATLTPSTSSSIPGVTLYDGEVKTKLVDGELKLSDRFIIWVKDSMLLSLPLALVVLAEEFTEGSLLSKKYFVIIHLLTAPPDRLPGPYSYSQFHQVRLRFKTSQASSVVYSHIQRTLSSSKPAQSAQQQGKQTSNITPAINLRGGLVRIEQDMQKRDAAVSRDISDAFQDFQRLIGRAGEMVELAKTIAEKARRQASVSSGEQGKDSLTADELIEFRSNLLALGVSGGVTKEDCASESNFYAQLATEMCRLLEPVIRKTGGGLMSLTDAYCRINRARGLNLVSPDDVLAATKMMEKQHLPLRLHQFSTGVRCLRLAEIDSRKLCTDTMNFILKQSKGCSIDSFAVLLSLPVAVARERLLAAESEGFLCRDETAAGISFYPNRFLHNTREEADMQF